MRWNKVSIIGVGLLGGSLGQALIARGLARQVVGCVRRKATLTQAKRARAVHTATLDFAAGVAEADLIVLCTPIAQMRHTLQQLLPHLKEGAIVTDVGSVKSSVVHELEILTAEAGAHFVGSHPMAGSDKMGVKAARPSLYEGAVCVVTPTKRTNRRAARAVEQVWKSVGARTIRLSPEAHDQLVARSSHLPHLLAALLVNHTLGKGIARQPLLCATGFRDTTRIASGSPEMWRDIAIANRANLARTLGEFTRELRALQNLIQQGNEQALTKFFEEAKALRDGWCNKAGYASPE